jgi:hypothetical protein
MIRIRFSSAVLVALLAGACSSNDDSGSTSKPLSCAGMSCQSTEQASSTGVGDPCTLGDEAKTNFGGYSEQEVNIESESPGCTTGLCLANHFQGRVSCPEGQPADPSDPSKADPAHQSCMTTGAPSQPVSVPVVAQLADRGADVSVYCSCRCDGPAGTGPFCACPGGFECAPLVQSFGTGSGEQLAGSYCIKAGTGVSAP